MDEDPRRARRERRAKAEAEYKQLTSELMALSRNEDMRKIQNIIKTHIDRTSNLYPIVKKKLAQTSKDSKHLRELLQIALDASKRIEATARPFDMKRIILNLMRDASQGAPTQCSNRITPKDFARFITENHVQKCLRRAPTFEFFYGALRSEGLIVKERRKRVKIDTNDINKTNKTTAKEKNLEEDTEQDSTPREVEHINRQINSLTRNKPDGVPFFSSLVDPKSFTLTVENIFHTSFLVKEGKVGVKKGVDCKEAILTYKSSPSEQAHSQSVAGDAAEGQQSVLSFTMDDFNRWISAYGIKRRAFPARDDNGTTSNNDNDNHNNNANSNRRSSRRNSNSNTNNRNGDDSD